MFYLDIEVRKYGRLNRRHADEPLEAKQIRLLFLWLDVHGTKEAN